jgi:alanine dehydrogenase
MLIGIAKEIKNNEYRVAIIPENVKALVKKGHAILIEAGAGAGSGIDDERYVAEGAEVVSKSELFERSDMLLKVKEFFPEEYHMLREGLIVMTYIHSNAHPDQTDALLQKKVIGISYEDVECASGFPLLKPMSEIAGKGGFIMALQYMQKLHGGPGVMLVNICGVHSPEITVIGAGNAGLGAAELAVALGNRVTVLDTSIEKLELAKSRLTHGVEFLFSNEKNLTECLKRSDVLLNCILWPKHRRDHLVTRKMLRLMKPGSLIVDIACDEHGAVETCRCTSHDDPVYVEEEVIHYCVDNIPGAFPCTSTYALCNATFPYVLEIADKGAEAALRDNPALRKGLSFYRGLLTLKETALKQGRDYTSPEDALGILKNLS